MSMTHQDIKALQLDLFIEANNLKDEYIELNQDDFNEYCQNEFEQFGDD